MKTVDEIVAAARELSVEQFLSLRRKLEQLEEKIWETELKRTTAKMKKANITEEEIDRLVMEHRRESRR
jgi:DNA-binding transcriptional regulator YhcF (GntR family)